MNIDLGSAALDVAVGLAFVFFLLSVVASALTEIFAGIVALRAKTLRAGLLGMLGDEGIVNAILAHPLVRTDLRKQKPKAIVEPGEAERTPDPRSESTFGRLLKHERGPSYISPRNFAKALSAVLEKGPEPKDDLEEQLKQFGGSAVVKNAAGAVEADVEKWFNDGMDRVSGWYKRRSQWVNLAAAILVAVGLNASALQIAQRLQNEPAARSATVKAAEKYIEAESGSAASGEGENGEAGEAAGGSQGAAGEEEKIAEGAAAIKLGGEQAGKALGEVEALKLPVFWEKANLPADWTFSETALWIAGLLLTIVAIMLGAPFWFDALGKLSNLRLAGKKPETEKPQTT